MASAAVLSILIKAQDKASGVLKGLENQTKGFGSTIMKHNKAIGMGMTAMGAGILAAGALSIKTFAEMGDEVEKMAYKTGFSTEALSEFRHVAEISGTTLGSLDKATKRMSKTIVDASEGMTTYIRAFDRIGLNVEELQKLKPEEQFDKIAMAIAGLEDHAMKAATAQDIFGRAGTELLPMLAQGAEGIADLRKEAHELGIVFDQEAAAMAAKFNDDMKRMQRSMDGVKMKIAAVLIPALTPLIEKITEVIKGITNWMKENPALAKTIMIAAGAIGGLMLVLGPLMIALPGIIAIAPAVGAAFSTMFGPVGLIAVAVTALAVGIGVLINKAKAAREEVEKMHAELTASKGFELWPAGLTEAERAAIRAKNAQEKLTESLATTEKGFIDATTSAEGFGIIAKLTAEQIVGAYKWAEEQLIKAKERLVKHAQGIAESFAITARLEAAQITMAYKWAVDEKKRLDMERFEAFAMTERLTAQIITEATAKAEREAAERRAKERILEEDRMAWLLEYAEAQRETARQTVAAWEWAEKGFKGMVTAVKEGLGQLPGIMDYIYDAAGNIVGLLAQMAKAYRLVPIPGMAGLFRYREVGYTEESPAAAAAAPGAPGEGWIPHYVGGQMVGYRPAGITTPTFFYGGKEYVWAPPGLVPGFQRGGIVPGPIGQPVPIIAHGGETVTPASKAAAGVTIVLSNPIFLGDESHARQLADIIGEELQRKVRQGFAFA